MKALRWVTIVLVLLLLLGVWVASIFAPELRSVAQAVTLTFVFLVLGFFFARWLRARLKAAAIERAMTKQKEPATDPRVAELQAKMQKAVDALKTRRKGRGGARASLYSLPWYVIVGPSAAGKTTALGKSSLSFVATADGSLKVRGTAGTRNCDWWFSHEAILLDTAGRFATEDNDRDEWMAFLDSLRRFRPDRPLDGLLVAVSVPDILSSDRAMQGQLAEKLRARLDEVLERLEMHLPVYLLLTKTDLVAGFVEFWSDLGKTQRSQVFGASFELDDPRLEEPTRAVEAEFDVLLDGLHARMLDRLSAERSPERRARILQFPIELRALRAPLATFIEALCRPDADGERPILRGFYLTSGTQVGRPVERVIAGMLRGFDLRGGSAAPRTAAGEEHSYFVSDVFRTVILPDRDLAARSVAGTQRRSRRELLLAMAALGVAVFVLLPAMVSYVRNAQLVDDVEGATQALASGNAGSVPAARSDPLERLLDTLDHLDQEASGFGIAGWFGPRAARELKSPTSKAYIERLDGALHARVQKELDRRVSEIAKSAGQPDPPTSSPQARSPLREDYDEVKLYAALVEPPGHIDLSWTPKQLVSIWRRTLPSVDTVDDARLLRHATEYLKALETQTELAWPAPKTLQGARSSLKQSDAWQLPLNWVLRHAFEVPGLVASDLAGSSQSIQYVTCQPGELIPGAYTKNGWRKVQPILDSSDPWPPEGLVEPWVVADTRIPDTSERVRAQARDDYFQQYVLLWMRLLGRCAVSRPTDPAVCKSELEVLSAPTGFYESLFLQFNNNTIGYAKKTTVASLLTQEGCSSKLPWNSNADAAAAAEPKSPVEKSFRPLLVFSGLAAPEADAPKAEGPPPLQQYRKILQGLIPLMESASQQRATEVKPQLTAARQGVEGLLGGIEDPATKAGLRKLLMPPLEAADVAVHRGLSGSISDAWKQQVWPTLHPLLGKFPFNKGPNVRREDAANFEAFAAVFRPPDGILWAFVKDPPFGDYVIQGAAGPIPKPGADSVGADVLSCLSVAQEITDAFFPPNEERGTKFAVLADWSAPEIADAKFSVGSKVMALTRGEWSSPIKWAGEDARLSYSQGGTQSQQVIGRGSFSLFDLFDQLGGLKPTVPRNYATKQSTLPLSIKVRSEARRDPFSPDFFSRLQCPAEIHPTPRP
ncbi:MAG TPA: type VI secretion system membrane subunit TssM [Polyangiaceae bacterium]|jgi:type VI secretion system protein ImpL|nr:type VI secretion system membrane subunit TssM [Polyangiaceae bacterium]